MIDQHAIYNRTIRAHDTWTVSPPRTYMPALQ
jgi:hypothetical protein